MIKNALVVETVLGLLLNGTVTASQVTYTAREYYTDFNFDEGFVSRVLSNLINNGILLYTYDGNNKIYKLNVNAFIQSPLEKAPLEEDSINFIKVDYNQMILLMSSLNKGDNVIVTFIKKDGDKRILNGIVLEPNKGDGKVLFIDSELQESDNIRSVNIKRVSNLIKDKTQYILN